MKNKTPYLLLLAMVLVNLLFNSCKKDVGSNLVTLLTKSKWQLVSVQVYHFIGSSEEPVDTLNTNCSLGQFFTFKTDNTCTYDNFICKQQSVTGHWQLSKDQLTLQADMAMQDTLSGGRDTVDHPFIYTQVVNLGLYSMVLQTGDINTYYTATTLRTIKRYAFVHVSQ